MLIIADVESRSAASASSCGEKKKKGLQMIQQVNAAAARINAMDSVRGLERLSPGWRLLAGFLSRLYFN